MTGAAKAARPKRHRRALWAGIAAVVLLGGAIWVAASIAPLMGVYLFPVSPADYVQLALQRLDSGYYAGTDAWRTERERVLAATDGVTDYAVIHAELQRATKVAGGKHSLFWPPERAQEIDQTATAEFREPTLRTESGITTITLPDFLAPASELKQRYADAAVEGITSAAPQTCGWIVDLRENTGGNMYPMLSGISPLLPNGDAMSFRSAGGTGAAVTVQGDGAGMQGRTQVKVAQVPKVTGQPIAVLYGSRTASSGEAVATVFRGLPGVESFGTPTAGYTSGNSVYKLPDGAAIVIIQGVYVDRTGTSLDELPMRPDHETAPDAAPQAASEWLRSQGCTG